MLQTTLQQLSTATLTTQGGVISTVADVLGCILPYISCVTPQSPGRLLHPLVLYPQTLARTEHGGWGSRISPEPLPGNKEQLQLGAIVEDLLKV